MVPAARNVISGNDSIGVLILSTGAFPASDNRVQGNFIGTDITGTADLNNGFIGVEINGSGNIIGGPEAGAGNVISGNYLICKILIVGASTKNIVQGNLIGTDVGGTKTIGGLGSGIIIAGAADNTIGGTGAASRNIISGNVSGVVIFGGMTRTVVQGNFIGTDITGTRVLGNRFFGVAITNASGNIIGGSEPGAGNVISGSDSNGVRLFSFLDSGLSRDNIVQGNLIGTDSSGTVLLGNGANGISIENTVGTSVQNNIIAASVLNGVQVTGDTSTSNVIRGNTIFNNGGLGIELGEDGVTPNDAGDGDTGPNNRQNFPVLTSAIAGGSITIEGMLNSTPETSFEIEFFANSECDVSGHGEGEIFLGTAAVTTDADGNASFNVTLADVELRGGFITATATDPDGNTSEFSRCLPVQVLPAAPKLIAPEDSASNLPTTVDFVWQALADAESYHLQLATSAFFTVLVFNDSTLTDTTLEVSGLTDTTTYYWRVRARNAVGFGPYSEVRTFTTGVTTTVDAKTSNLPRHFILHQNYPNPFNPATTIRYALPRKAAVRLVVSDLLGREVAVLVEEEQPAGWHSVTFDASQLPSGVYLYRLEAGDFVQARKMVVLK